MSAAMKAVCAAAGWDYCVEHDRPLYRGSAPCIARHPKPEPRHATWCQWPDNECICPGGPR